MFFTGCHLKVKLNAVFLLNVYILETISKIVEPSTSFFVILWYIIQQKIFFVTEKGVLLILWT